MIEMYPYGANIKINSISCSIKDDYIGRPDFITSTKDISTITYFYSEWNGTVVSISTNLNYTLNTTNHTITLSNSTIFGTSQIPYIKILCNDVKIPISFIDSDGTGNKWYSKTINSDSITLNGYYPGNYAEVAKEYKISWNKTNTIDIFKGKDTSGGNVQSEYYACKAFYHYLDNNNKEQSDSILLWSTQGQAPDGTVTIPKLNGESSTLRGKGGPNAMIKIAPSLLASDYLKFGGLPAVNPDNDVMFNEGLLEGIFNTILIKDILSRMKTDDVSKITSIVRFLYSNIGNTTNVDNIAKATGINNVTVSKYIGEMCKAFLFYYAERYDIVGKRILRSNGKYYTSDIGMRNAMLKSYTGRDISKPLENVIYLELLRRGYDVKIGSYKDHKVDFTATGPEGVEYFQVCQTLMAEETYRREIRPFEEIKDNYPKTILTLDRLGLGSDNGVRIVNVIDWLLNE